jgi:flagellar motor switch protein FliM
MARALSQQEIDAVVRARRAKSAGATVPQRVVRSCDFRIAGQLSNDKARTLTTVHEAFAQHVTRSLGAYLRVPFQIALMSVEQLPFREFLERMPPLMYAMSFQMHPQQTFGALQIDQALVFSIVDVLLGGTGESVAILREVTEIEEHIMEGVTTILSRELEAQWRPFGVRIQLDQRQHSAQMQQFMNASEKALVLSFEVNISEVRGMLNLVFPSSVSKVMARELSKDFSTQRRRQNDSASQRIREKLLDSNISVELGIPQIKARTREVLAIKVGDILRLHISVQAPAALMIAARPVFQASPVRLGGHRAAQIGDRVQQVTEGQKKHS